MHALLDNAFIRLVGTVLDSRRGECITRSGALALFHLAEHILFDEAITLSNAPGSPTYDQVKMIIEGLEREGVLQIDGGNLLTIRAFDLDECHRTACENASHRMSNLLHSLKAAEELEQWGKDAIEWQQAIGGGLFEFEKFVREEPVTTLFLDLVKARDNVPSAEEEYVVRYSPVLQAQIKSLTQDTGWLSLRKKAALSALTRLYINEGLAGSVQELYAPVPQRAALADQANQLVARRMKSSFRARLNDTIADALREQGCEYVVPLLREMESLNAFPLPLLALHLLSRRPVKVKGPLGILQEARRARDSDEARRMRAYLTEWEAKLARSPTDAMEALSKIKRVVEEEMRRDMGLDAKKTSKTASIKMTVPFMGIELDPEWLDLHPPEMRSLFAWTRQHQMQHHFLPAVARTPTNAEGDFDIWFNDALQRRFCPEDAQVRA